MNTIKNKILVDQAKVEWVNTMRKKYPKFNPKLWGKSFKYRQDHPQEALKH